MERAQTKKPRLKKSRKKSRYETVTDWARETAQVITYPVGRVLAKLGVHPNTLTLLGFFLTASVALVLTTGRLALGGWLLGIVTPLDAFDGALARVGNQKSRFGAFLDSTLDRVSEASVLIGLMIHYLQQGMTTEVILTFVALTGATMVSYTRARAEALGFSCKVGLMTRFERATVLILGLVLGWTTWALWILAVGTVLTTLHRMLHVYQLSRKEDFEAAPTA